MTDHKQVSREEDFLDYEERDVRVGWPYADSDDARRAGQNAPYGITGAGLDRVENEGIEITSGPTGRDVEGEKGAFAENAHEAISDDALGAWVLEALDRDGRFDLQMLDLTIRDGVAELDGAVDSQDERR
ncbi:hypothetical protein MUO32_23470 [Shinella sp. CPCC 101442]|uniref:hypothetical protein n=1 Tax=Shinella sp. CPCC 101442 TaxID=2932265 RepID=UPI002153993B|nr:hypothetical protein [Shinella sp. CPCC 101442]MCR6501999.1 hypothetical protein [Shinella sp. CPCC 101442]